MSSREKRAIRSSRQPRGKAGWRRKQSMAELSDEYRRAIAALPPPNCCKATSRCSCKFHNCTEPPSSSVSSVKLSALKTRISSLLPIASNSRTGLRQKTLIVRSIPLPEINLPYIESVTDRAIWLMPNSYRPGGRSLTCTKPKAFWCC